jgi:hypothetical protein
MYVARRALALDDACTGTLNEKRAVIEAPPEGTFATGPAPEPPPQPAHSTAEQTNASIRRAFKCARSFTVDSWRHFAAFIRSPARDEKLATANARFVRLLGRGPSVLVLATSTFIALSACGGGRAGPPAVNSALPATTPATRATAGPAGFATASFTISLPKVASAANRKALFVSPSTTSISVAVNGTTPQVFACTPPVCSGSFLAPAGGQDNFLFAALDAQSNVLANAPVTQAIAANGTNTIAVTLNGVVANAALSATPAGLSSAASGQSTVSATAYDVDGNVITGTYSSPIVVSTTDGTGTIALTGATLAGSTSTATLTYTYSPATAYAENHFGLGETSATETTAQPVSPFEVGRTFYTFTPNAIVGFAPGATAPTRTIAISPSFLAVSALACDGTNLYVVDFGYGEYGVVYGIAPGATTPTVSYTSGLNQPIWLAANGQPTGNRAQFYVANDTGETSAIVGFQGPVSTPFTIPPDVAVQTSGAGNFSSLQIDGNGNVYAGGSVGGYGGYEILSPSLSLIAAGSNFNAVGANQIAVDTSSAPTIRVYTEELNYDTSEGEVSEYDNDATTPTYVSTDNSNDGLFVDGSGRVYTSTGIISLPSRLRASSVHKTSGRAHPESGPPGFDVYAQGGLAGSVQYTLPGVSLAFDSAGYTYAVSAAGSITEFAPGGATVVATFPGTSYGMPSYVPYQFGTFCQ